VGLLSCVTTGSQGATAKATTRRAVSVGAASADLYSCAVPGAVDAARSVEGAAAAGVECTADAAWSAECATIGTERAAEAAVSSDRDAIVVEAAAVAVAAEIAVDTAWTEAGVDINAAAAGIECHALRVDSDQATSQKAIAVERFEYLSIGWSCQGCGYRTSNEEFFQHFYLPLLI